MDSKQESILPLLEDEEQSDVEEQKIEPKKRTFREILDIVGIYPTLCLMSCSYTFHYPVFMSFVYWARCVEINYQQENPDQFCHNLTGTKAEQKLQLDVAVLHLYWRLFGCVPALIVTPILGAWSDGSGGRKKPLLICMTGSLLFLISNVICTQIYRNMSIYPWILGSHVIHGGTGYESVETAAMFAMVTDCARHKKQEGKSITLHVSLATFLASLSKLPGGLLASWVTAEKSTQTYFIGTFASTCIFVLALLYTIFFVKDTYCTEWQKEHPKPLKNSKNDSLTSSLVLRMKEILVTLRRKRAGWTRFCLLVTVACAFVELIAEDNGLVFLFVKRAPFHWSDATWAKYILLWTTLYTLGNGIWPRFLTKIFNPDRADLIMVLIGLCALLGYYLTMCLSTTTWMVMFGCSASFIYAMLSPGYRSFIPKLVQQNETGRIFAVFGMANLLAPIISSLIFNNIYQATAEVYPGFAFLIAAILVFCVLLAMSMVYVLMLATWRQISKSKSTNEFDLNEM